MKHWTQELEARWWRRLAEAQERAEGEVRAAIDRYLETLERHEPPTPRQRAERRGLRVIEGGKTK